MTDVGQQRAEALTRANEVRGYRAELRRRLKVGKVDPWDLLRGDLNEWEPWIRTLKIEKLLEWVPGVGLVTIEETFARFSLSRRMTVETMTFQLRAEMAALLRAAIERDMAPAELTNHDR